jgi:hypothetical protein
VIPAAQDVTGADGNRVVEDRLARKIVVEQRVYGLPLARLEDVPLDCRRVLGLEFPVRPESHMSFMPSIRDCFADGRRRVSEIRVVSENTVGSIPADLSSVLQEPFYGFLGTGVRGDEASRRGL